MTLTLETEIEVSEGFLGVKDLMGVAVAAIVGGRKRFRI